MKQLILKYQNPSGKLLDNRERIGFSEHEYAITPDGNVSMYPALKLDKNIKYILQHSDGSFTGMVPNKNWQRYWGNQGSGSVSLALERVAKPILEGIHTASYFTPAWTAAYAGDIIANTINHGVKSGIATAAMGMLPTGRISKIDRWAKRGYIPVAEGLANGEAGWIGKFYNEKSGNTVDILNNTMKIKQSSLQRLKLRANQPRVRVIDEPYVTVVDEPYVTVVDEPYSHNNEARVVEYEYPRNTNYNRETVINHDYPENNAWEEMNYNDGIDDLNNAAAYDVFAHLFRNGGQLIPKYQSGGPLSKYYKMVLNSDRTYSYKNIKTGEIHSASEAAQWLTLNHVGNYNAQSFSKEFDRQNPQQLLSSPSRFGKGLVNTFTEYFRDDGFGKSLFKASPIGAPYIFAKNMWVQDEELPLLQRQLVLKNVSRTMSANNYDEWWKPNYWAKIGLKQRGLGYDDYMKSFNEWFTSSGIDPRYRNLIAKRNWDTYVSLGYNKKPVSTTNNNETSVSNVYGGGSSVTNEWENKYNDLNTKYEQVLKELNELKNPTEPVKTVEETSLNGNTYESLVQANTAAFNNGINSAYWRKNFRKSFNNALLNGDMYGINPNGSQVFDINGMNVSEMIQNIGGLDPRKGLTRRGMRLLKKLQKAYNGNIFENVNAKVRTLPFQEMSNLELDSLGQDALPLFLVQNHGLDVPFINPTYEESDEGDIVNIGTKTIPFYQELKQS